MGYTHYWYINPDEVNINKYKQALLDMSKVIKNQKDILAGWDGSGLPSYIEDDKKWNELLQVFTEGDSIIINGIGSDAHETFGLPSVNTFHKEINSIIEAQKKYKISHKAKSAFDCCKTREKKYDIVVTACLAILKDVVNKGIDISSDGDVNMWIPGCRLAADVLNRYIECPLDESTDEDRY